MNIRRSITMGLLLASLHCGSSASDALLAKNATWPGGQATGSLMVGDAVLCSATLVDPYVVVTSGRCARAAMASSSYFRWRQGTAQFDTPVRQGHALRSDGSLTEPSPRWRPAVATSQQRAAVRSIQRHCGVEDMFALGCAPGVRYCLDGVKLPWLKAAGGVGLAAWQDVGWLGLADAVPTEPARMALGDIPNAWQANARLLRVGVRQVRGLRVSPLQRYEDAYGLYEHDATELHAGPQRSLTHADWGSALYMETYNSGEQAWRLVGVASRPFVAHSDTSAGIIFSRVDVHAAIMAEAISRLRAFSAP